MTTDRLKHIVLVQGAIVGSVAILYFGKTLFAPLALAGVLAMLFTPLVDRFCDRGWGEGWGIALSALILLAIVGLLVGLVFWQVQSFSDQWGEIQRRAQEWYQGLEHWATSSFGVKDSAVQERLGRMASDFLSTLSAITGNILSVLSQGLLTFVYFILMLMERKRFFRFAVMVAPDNEQDNAEAAFRESRQIAAHYLIGKLEVMGILAVFYALGFLLGGIQFAILLALQAALFSIIPYLGNVIGGGIAVALAFLSGGGPTGALIVIGIMAVAQLLENYLLAPWIIGDEIDLNPWATVVAVVGFGLVWGIIGAVLALPLVGMFRMICKHFAGLRSIGFLLGRIEE
jgi:predicted PurR-regulated permease PerM